MRRIVESFVLLFGLCSAKSASFEGSVIAGDEQTIENVRVTNLNYIFTVSWDPLERQGGDEDAKAPTLYTVDDYGDPLGGCVNITETSCDFDFNTYHLLMVLRVVATVDGLEKGRSEETDFFLYDIKATVQSPTVNVTREDANVTVRLDRPSPFSTTVTSKFIVKYFYFASGKRHHMAQKETYGKEVTFLTSAPKDSRICVEAQIKIVSYVHKSNWTKACTDDEQTKHQQHKPNISRFYGLITGLVVGTVALAILIWFGRKHYHKSLQEKVDELPKDTAKVIAMSYRSDAITGGFKEETYLEKFSRIDGTDPPHLETDLFLSERLEEVNGREGGENDVSEPLTSLHPSTEHSQQLGTSIEVEHSELPFPEEATANSIDDVTDDCGELAGKIQMTFTEDECPDLSKPDDVAISFRKQRLESKDSAFSEILSASTSTGKDPGSQRVSLADRSRASVSSSCSVDEGYVRVPSQDNARFAETI